MDYSLSNTDITNSLNGKCNIIMYEDLRNVDNIEDVLINDCCIILYQNTKNNGHWVVLNKRYSDETPIFEFFDSYGGAPDSQLKYSDYNAEQGRPLLLPLLNKTSTDVIYNPFDLQKVKSDINTCGRWVVLRVQYKQVPLLKFVNFFYKNKRTIPPDKLVTIITNKLYNL